MHSHGNLEVLLVGVEVVLVLDLALDVVHEVLSVPQVNIRVV